VASFSFEILAFLLDFASPFTAYEGATLTTTLRIKSAIKTHTASASAAAPDFRFLSFRILG
jgi:uncharacterized protein (DUF736 family)